MAASVKTAALRFLKIRPHSQAELEVKLRRKGFEASEIEATVVDLKNTRLVDDRAFTKSWINYRLARPFGFQRIIGELKIKGVAEAIIQEMVAEAKTEYVEGDIVLGLARRRWERLGNIDPQKKKKRMFDFLLRRGYSVDAVMKVIKKL